MIGSWSASTAAGSPCWSLSPGLDREREEERITGSDIRRRLETILNERVRETRPYEYLDDFEDAGLIAVERDQARARGNDYRLTDEGRAFLSRLGLDRAAAAVG